MISQAFIPHIFIYCNWTCLRYILPLIFQMEKQITATGRAFGTSHASHFRWKKMYLQLDGSQIYIAPYILGKKTGIYNRSGLRYTLRLIFQVKNQVPITNQAFLPHIFVGQALSIYCASHFGWKNKYLDFQPDEPQIHTAHHILGKKIDTFDQTSKTAAATLASRF